VKTWDLIVVGGGIIGLSLAIALRKRGATVLIVERGEPGREASHAAGGMLVDSPLETPAPLQGLALASAQMYPDFAHELEVESGTKVDSRDAGSIVFPALNEVDPLLQSAWSSNTPAAIRELEPSLTYHDGPGFYLKERSVDPRALTSAAVKTAKQRGVDFSSGDPVTGVDISDGCACGVTTTKSSFSAGKVVNCAGAWSGQIAPLSFPTRPVKGQMLCLIMPSRTLLKHVIRTPEVYLIPRSDGRLLVGASVEEAGFDKRTTEAKIKEFHAAALAVVPGLKEAKILEDWAGLRPGTPDALPILGETSIPGYYAATGHFRDGILLAPITAKLMADMLTGRKAEHDLEAFSPVRFQRQADRPLQRF
jgi:glycine oxidase